MDTEIEHKNVKALNAICRILILGLYLHKCYSIIGINKIANKSSACQLIISFMSLVIQSLAGISPAAKLINAVCIYLCNEH